VPCRLTLMPVAESAEGPAQGLAVLAQDLSERRRIEKAVAVLTGREAP